MKRTKLIAVMAAAIIFVAGPSGYLLAQHMQGGPMMQPPAQQKSPTAESGQRSQQRGPGSGSDMGPPYGMGPGGGYGPGYGYGMGPGMMGQGWGGGYGMMGPGMGMMGPGMMGGMAMGGGFGPGMMGPVMASIMRSPEVMGLMMSMHGEMMALVGEMIQRYGAEPGPEASQKMQREMLQQMGEIFVKQGNRLKESSKTSSR